MSQGDTRTPWFDGMKMVLHLCVLPLKTRHPIIARKTPNSNKRLPTICPTSMPQNLQSPQTEERRKSCHSQEGPQGMWLVMQGGMQDGVLEQEKDSQ